MSIVNVMISPVISPVVTLLGVPVWDGSLTLYIYYQLPSDWSVKSNCKNGKDVSRAQGKSSNIICKKVSHICQISKKTEPLLLHSWIYCQHFQTWRSCETVNRKQGNRTDYAKSLSVKSRETGKKTAAIIASDINFVFLTLVKLILYFLMESIEHQ